MFEYLKYWMDKGLETITPLGKNNPEGFCLSEVLGFEGSILEIGAGTGRIAGHFPPHRYLGVDINPLALKQAKKSHPDHEFMHIDLKEQLPVRDVVLLYTVCLHIPDEIIWEQLERFCKAAEKRVVIAEIMNPDFRKEADGYTISNQRDRVEYEMMMSRLGWKLDHMTMRDYAHYPGEVLTMLEFVPNV